MRTRDENKEQLVRQKAIELVVKDGLEGFSMQKLAKAAGVSPATLYIYYKDKDDLITSIGREIGSKFSQVVLQDFDPNLSFSEGMKIQWRNRARYSFDHPLEVDFYEQVRSSSFREKVSVGFGESFKIAMGEFMHRAIKRGELTPVPLEVFWSIAYAPLYNLIRFHNEGTSVGGQSFTIAEDVLNQTLTLVLKALKP